MLLKLEAGLEQTGPDGQVHVMQPAEEPGMWLLRTKQPDGTLRTLFRTRTQEATQAEIADGIAA